MIEWIIIVGIVIAMYIIIYKYEKKMDNLQKIVLENQSKISKNREHIDDNYENITDNKEKISKNRKHIDDNHGKLKEHHSHIDRMWITIPKRKEDS